jgi:hypothetical protein
MIPAGHQWLTSVILATQETEIRRIVVESQPGQIICKILSQKTPLPKKGWWSGSRCRPEFKPQYSKKKYSNVALPSSWSITSQWLCLTLYFVSCEMFISNRTPRPTGSAKPTLGCYILFCYFSGMYLFVPSQFNTIYLSDLFRIILQEISGLNSETILTSCFSLPH